MTSSRADYSLLRPVMRAVQGDPSFRLRLVVTGSHLAIAHGGTVAEIRADGFPIDAEVELPMAGDSEAAVGAAMGAALSGVSSILAEMRPDLVVVLGDRYEILAVAAAAAVCRIPLAHIAGGDVTEGAVDELFRHAITKLANIHFVTNEEARQRLRQMGEDPKMVHLVGSPGLDEIRTAKTVSRRRFTEKTGYQFQSTNLLVTFHPSTSRRGSAARECTELLAALEKREAGMLFTGVNADQERAGVEQKIREFCDRHPRAIYRLSLGIPWYFSALRHFDVVVGNSSSGLYEAPSFRVPTVDIGDRQKGRLAASSVIHCAARRKAIGQAIEDALRLDCSEVVNPYGDGHAAERCVAALKEISNFARLAPKRFYEND